MTREDLVRLIYFSDYCPVYNCNSTLCKECGSKALTEYENEIYNKALKDLWLKVISKYDEYLSLKELDVCIDELKEDING